MAAMNAPRYRCGLGVVADYHQFYVWDPVISRRRVPDDWSEEDVAHHAKAGPGVVVICPARRTEIPVDVSLWDFEPEVILEKWQHVIEATLGVGSPVIPHAE